MATLTHWKKLHNPDYLGAYALAPGEELVVTIKAVVRETVAGEDGKKEECTVVRFADTGVKPMVLNVTNSKTISKLYDTPYIEEWAGKKIQIYATQVKAFGSMVEALRIRPKIPASTFPELSPAHDKWTDAVRSLASGKVTLDYIRQKFILTEDNENLLLQEASSCQNQDS